MASSRAKARPFTISDAMILVAASAVGLAWVGQARGSPAAAIPQWNGTWRTSFSRAAVVSVFFLACLSTWTLGWLAIGIRTPGRSWRQISRRPGMVACLAAGTVLGIWVLRWVTVAIVLWWRGEWTATMGSGNMAAPLLIDLRFHLHQAGIWVLAAWTIAVYQRRWRPEPSWFDRGGRLIGVLWVVYIGILFGISVLDTY